MRGKGGESVVKKRLGYALGLALATAVASAGGARAMSANAWHDLLEVLPDLKQMFDAAPGLIANDLPSLVSADNDLQERLDRAKKFHVTHVFNEAEPKIDGDRLFSKDPHVATAMRDEYAHYVESEARDLEMLKTRREAQASHLTEYQRLFDRNADFANKAPDLIGSAGKVSDEMAQELAGVLMTAQQAAPLAQGLVDEYQRILREYDRKIGEEEAAHAGHVSTLRIIDAIYPKPKPDGHGIGGDTPSASAGAGEAAAPRGATPGQRIREAINGATTEVDAHATQSQNRLSSEQRQMGPIRPIPGQQGPSMPSKQVQPQFYGTITPYFNSK
jgi:hypothetical protein